MVEASGERGRGEVVIATALQIRILGHLRVLRDGSPITLGGPRQQRVLAVLLGGGRQSISIDRLIDGVWGDEPPRTARKTLQGYVHHLRSEFGDAIETNESGYRLNAEPGQVDAWEFDRLADEATDVQSSDPAQTIQCCSEALELWQGLAYEGFEDSIVLQPEIVRLTERRLEVVEARLDARLALGQAAATIAELESLTRHHPFRERFRLLHMTALYGAGRQAESLRAFEHTRVVLAEELGLAPGPELQDLHRRILEHDPSLNPEPARIPLGAVASRANAVTMSSRSLPRTAPLENVGLRGYELRGVLAQSDTRAVHRAFHASVGREVLIRSLLGEAANRTELIECFDDEIRRLSQISQPAGDLILDAWREPDAMYRVEPWLEGGSLRSRLLEARSSASEILRLFQDIAGTLRQAHQHGFCHEQLTPSSIRFDDYGRAHLVDFRFQGTNRLDQGAEWLVYAAPEVRHGGTARVPESDIYSLGILLLHVLEVLHVGDSSVGSWRDAETVIGRASAEDPALRYRSLDAFLGDVISVLGPPTERETPSGSQRHELVDRTASGRAADDEQATIRNPFKGLRAFQQTDSADFFGRERTVQHVVTTAQSNRFIAIVGPSGVGKSSLVKAGLLPAIRMADGFVEPSILIAEMFPGRYPFEELLTAITGVAVTQPVNGLEQLMHDEAGLSRMLECVLPADGRELLLVIDQFEELFSLVTDDDERALFIDNLVAAVNDPESRLRVVITLRADYYDRPLEFAGLGALLEDTTVPIRSPDAEGLRRAIEAPAAAVGLMLGAGLVDQIIDDLANQPGGLPLLQYALAELVDGRSTNLLTVEAYHEMGGVLGAIAARAEEIWQGLDVPEQRAIRQVFLRLVTMDDSATGTRRRALRSELRGLTISETDLANTLQAYGEHRLLSFDRDQVTRSPTIEVAHEALLQRWPRLHLWISEERERLILRRRLVVAMAEWESSGHDPSYVLRGSRLAQYESWDDTRSLMLTGPEQQFLTIGQELRDEEADVERRTNRRLRVMLAGAIVFALIALVAGTFGIVQAGRAEREAQVAEANRVDAEVGRLALRAPQLLESDRQVALLLAVEAVRRAPDPVSFGALQEVLAQTDGFLGYLAADQRFEHVAFTPAGNLVALSADRLTLFDKSLNWQPLSWPLTGATQLAVDPSGERVAIADAQGIRLLALPTTVTDEQSSIAPPLLLAGPDHVTAMSYNASGSVLAVGDAVGLLTLIELATNEQQSWRPHPETDTVGFEIPAHQPDEARLGIRALAFSKDNTQIATGGLIFARIWDLESQSLRAEIRLERTVQNQQTNAAVRAIRFHDEQDQIVVASSYGTRLHDIESGRLISETLVEGRALAIGTPVTDSKVTVDAEAMTLSLQGGEIVITSFDGTPERRIDAQLSGIVTTAADPSGSLLAIGSAEGIVLWSLQGRGLIHRSVPRRGTSDVSFNHDGERITLSTPQGLPLRYIDISNGQESELLVPPEPIAQYGWTGDRPGIVFWNFDSEVAYLRTGKNLEVLQVLSDGTPFAVGRMDGFVAIGFAPTDAPSFIRIVTESGQPAAELTRLGELDPDGGVASMSFNNDSTRLVANSGGGAAVVWDTTTWEVVSVLAHGGGQIVVSGYSKDGRMLVTVSEDGTILLRDPETFQQVGPALLGQVDGVSGFSYGPSFSDDGRLMFTGGDGRLRIWDLTTNLQIGDGFATDAGSSASSSGPALRGSTVVGEEVRLWNLDVDSWVDIACQAAGRNLTAAEWLQFGSKADHYPTTCPQWPSDVELNEGTGE